MTQMDEGSTAVMDMEEDEAIAKVWKEYRDQPT